MYSGTGDALAQAFGRDEVVDAPTRVLFARLEAVRPPRVGRVVGVQRAESVDEAFAEESGHLRTLLVGEARILAVRLRVLQVNLLVRHVQVATYYHRLLCVQTLDVLQEVVLPLHAVVETAQSVLRVRRVARHEIEVLHLKRYHSALVVVLVNADAVRHAEWRVSRVDSRARVSFLLGVVPVGCVTLKLKVELSCLHLGFLQAEKIRVERAERLFKVFLHASAESVYVP